MAPVTQVAVAQVLPSEADNDVVNASHAVEGEGEVKKSGLKANMTREILSWCSLDAMNTLEEDDVKAIAMSVSGAPVLSCYLDVASRVQAGTPSHTLKKGLKKLIKTIAPHLEVLQIKDGPAGYVVESLARAADETVLKGIFEQHIFGRIIRKARKRSVYMVAAALERAAQLKMWAPIVQSTVECAQYHPCKACADCKGGRETECQEGRCNLDSILEIDQCKLIPSIIEACGKGAAEGGEGTVAALKDLLRRLDIATGCVNVDGTVESCVNVDGTVESGFRLVTSLLFTNKGRIMGDRR
ncbi:hypothetical protein KIPB_009692 [Kipferlia bialata]|uniref:Uncharacterized protein n=1 Tax=Kipferlia bialata TaxID=797122 RepID=A0A9K3D2T3_9EUKA|nr:hypothetical protein KIPB_009692 [Kipferlia bialata]|eukprot:g9692.t1